MRSLREPDLRSLSDLEMACEPIPGKGCALAEVTDRSALCSAHGRKQPMAGRGRREKSYSQSLRWRASNSSWNSHDRFQTAGQEPVPKTPGVASRRVRHRYRWRVTDGCKQKCAVVVRATVAFARSARHSCGGIW